MSRTLFHRPWRVRWLAALLFSIASFGFSLPGADPGVFATPLRPDDLDPAAFAQWVDGQEQPLPQKNGPRHVLWTQTTAPEWDGVKFGESKTAGPRHLRIGFKQPVAVGSVLARAGGTLSVLKPAAAYPGNLAHDAEWLPAQRLKHAALSSDEAGKEDYALWVLPPGTATRALRFTHTADFADKDYAGWLGGVFVLGGRFANLAPQAVATASARNEAANKLNNESNDGLWPVWDNGKDGSAAAISPQHPEWLLLVWPREVQLRGLNALWAGFGACEAQVYAGPAERHPREAAEADWKTVRAFARIENQYPRSLAPNWLDFGQTLSTRAVRLNLTQVTTESHPHLNKNTRDGKRVWLGELVALAPLGNADLASAIPPVESAEQPHPPIAIRFTLPEPGFVTLVIDDERGNRVRNLISETPFPAGANVAWWDGTDDLQRDPAAARHGIYRIPERFVEPGRYRVRGLWRKAIDLCYEFSIYNAGSPAWETADGTGAWLANHTPPCGALFVPADRAPGGQALIYLGSFVSEGGHGLAWVDLDGRKRGGVGWVGGVWTGGPFLARDDGPRRDTNVALYVAAPWSTEGGGKEKRGEIRLTAVPTKGAMKPVLKYSFAPSFATNTAKTGDQDWFGEFGGLAARDGVLVFSLPKLNQLVVVDSRDTNSMGRIAIRNPRGLGFDAQGRLLVLAENNLLRGRVNPASTNLLGAETIIASLPPVGGARGLPAPSATSPSPPAGERAGVRGRSEQRGIRGPSLLESPRALALDSNGNIFISDHGNSHQIKVFSPGGKFIRAIGQAGKPKTGPYDPLHMNHPDGLTIDAQGRLWVAENDYQPKRVSVWTTDGRFVRAFYGPSEYGGGGTLDPEDKTRFYFHGMEFRLDWAKGTDALARVYWRPDGAEFNVPDGHAAAGLPERPFYLRGRRYFANCDNSNPTGGPGAVTLWRDDGDQARPVAALGRAQDWKLLQSDAFKPLWPQGVNLQGDYWQNAALFAWCDLNDDSRVQTNEVQMRKAVVGSVNVAPDLSLLASRVGTNAMRFAPTRFTAKGTPVYDLAAGQVLARGAQGPTSSGGDQALWHESGWTILTTPPKPFAPQSLGGVFHGEPRWSYPNCWPGLHASHESPPPQFPGMVIGCTRLVGGFITPRGGDAGPLWAINGNQGNLYLFTADGLFVAELFKDVRLGKSWSMPVAQRGMRLNALSLHDENFWPTLTQTKDGQVYLCDGARTSLVRVEGLDSIRRLPESSLTLSPADLQAARGFFLAAEARRQQAQGRGTLAVAIRPTPPIVDGKLDDWSGAVWVDVDKSGTAAYFDSDSKPHDVTAAVCIAGDRLYAAWRADDENLLKNSGEQPHAAFKTGGALDLMLGANPQADDRRSRPAEGDLRLLVTQVKGKPFATLYRAVVPGAKEPVPFSSPWRTITLDRVEDVSALVELATTTEKDAKGKLKAAYYEMSVPLAALGLKPVPGLGLRGDIGILRGNGFQTTQRVYWSNKATGITADVPSEAELTPQLWGRWEFVAARP